MEGYIYRSDKIGRFGSITCCSCSVDEQFWSFSFDDCDAALRAKLQAKDIAFVVKGKCDGNRPPGRIDVTFDRKSIAAPFNIATNVTQG